VASRKIIGRRCAPPKKWLPKNLNVWFWCIYTIPLELILSKIPEKSQCPPPAGRRAGKPDWLAGKKFPPPSPSPFFARSSLAEI